MITKTIEFDLVEREIPLTVPLEDLGVIRTTLTLIPYFTPPVGQDEDGDFIYEPATPEEEEKQKWFKQYRLVAMKHSLPKEERKKGLGDGLLYKAFLSPLFDSRDPESERAALREILGTFVIYTLKLL